MSLSSAFLRATCLVALLAGFVVCPPVDPNSKESDTTTTEEYKFDPNVQNDVNETIEHDPILAIEYNKYLEKVLSMLQSDPEFKKRIENATSEDLKTGLIATHLDFVHHNVRSKLDELKRQEIDRLRKLIARKIKLDHLEPHLRRRKH